MPNFLTDIIDHPDFPTRLRRGVLVTLGSVVLVIVLLFPMLALWLPGQLITSHFG